MQVVAHFCNFVWLKSSSPSYFTICGPRLWYNCEEFTKQQPFWVSFLPLISVKVLCYHLKAKKDAEIQAKKVAKIQAKKVAKIQAKMDAEIQGKKNAEIQLFCLNFSIHFCIGMLHKYQTNKYQFDL